MSAPVRIEGRAWSDLRFATLARLLGLADSDHALIKVARLWSWQTEHFTADQPTYVLDADIIESVLGTGGPAALVRAKLATEVAGGYRLHGTEGQIEWRGDLSSTRQQAGRARAAGARRDARGRLLPRENCETDHQSPARAPADVQQTSSTAPAKSSALTLTLSPEDQNLSPARDPSAPEYPTRHGMGPGGEPPVDPAPDLATRGAGSTIEARQARRKELWSELETARRETAEALRLKARPLPAQDPGERELSSLLAGGDLDRVTVDVRHAIAMAVLEAQRDRSVQWLTGGIFSERQFRRLVGMTPEDAMRQRSPPRGSAERAPDPTPTRPRMNPI